MRNILFLLTFLSFLNRATTQSISLQVGSRITPNPFYWAYHSPHKQIISGAAAIYYQPKISKKIELVTGLQISYTQFTYQYGYFADCITGMTEIPINIKKKVTPINTALELGANILLFSTPNKKWAFWLGSGLRLGGISWINTNAEIQYKNGSSETAIYHANYQQDAVERYGTLGGQIGEETRFHFTPHFFACAKVWGSYEYTFLDGRKHHGIGTGLQLGTGYKWK